MKSSVTGGNGPKYELGQRDLCITPDILSCVTEVTAPLLTSKDWDNA